MSLPRPLRPRNEDIYMLVPFFQVIVLRCGYYEIIGVEAWVALELLKYGYQCVGLIKFYLVIYGD